MAGEQVTINQVSYECHNGYAPAKGPRALPLSLDFSLKNAYDIDLSLAVSENKIEWVQSIFVDNSDNARPLYVTSAISNQIVIFPAGWQGYMALITPNDPRLLFVTEGLAGIGPVVEVLLLTVPVANCMWPSGEGSSGLDDSANQPSFPPAGLSLLGTLALNPARANVFVQNQEATDIQVWLDDGGGGNLSRIILATGGATGAQGGDWSSQTFKGRVRVYGALATDQVCIRED